MTRTESQDIFASAALTFIIYILSYYHFFNMPFTVLSEILNYWSITALLHPKQCEDQFETNLKKIHQIGLILTLSLTCGEKV